MAATRLLLLTDQPPRCLRIGERGEVVERLAPTPQAPLPAPAPGERTVLAVPGAEVRATRMRLDARSDVQARAEAHARLTATAADGSDLHVALHAPATGEGKGEGDGESLVLVAAAARMREWLAQAATLGAVPDAVVPDYLLLPAGGEPLVVEVGDNWLVRGGERAFTAERRLAVRLLGDAAIPPVAAPAEVEQLLARGAIAAHPLDLLQGGFAPRSARRASGSWRRVAVLAALLAGSPLLLVLAEGIRDRIHAGAGEAVHAEVASRLGIAHAPGEAAAAIADEHALLAAGDRHAADVGALFAAVQARPDAAIERLDYGRDGFEAVVRHRGADSGRAIVEALQSAGLEADAAAGATLGEDTLTTLRMRRLP